jgi:hypothetical protein
MTARFFIHLLGCASNVEDVRTAMERLDQGHLHPKLEALRLTSLGWESNPGLRGGK